MRLSKRFDYHYIQINGSNQFVAITKNIKSDKPLILFLHGGPGMVISPILDQFLPGAENYYNLAIWDQCGAGLSFNSNIQPETMNLSQLIEYTKEITLWLQAYLKVKQIILMGHSWGSTLGIYTVHKYPDLFSRFVSIGQWLIDDTESTKVVIRNIQKISLKNQILAKNLDKITRMVKEGFYWADDILIENGYELENITNTWNYQMDLVKNSTLYNEHDRQSYSNGMSFSENLDLDVKHNYNVNRDIQNIPIASLFIIGENDLVTPSEPILNFLYNLKHDSFKPVVEVLKKSRHFPFLDNSEKLLHILNQYLLK